MLYDRKETIDKISRTLSILMCDVKLHQSMNDFSINIHAEDFFKDIINKVRKANFVNANSSGKNEAYIDLVDHNARRVIQVTSTVTKQKIDNSLQILNNPAYKGYTLEILYLLEKPQTFKPLSIEEFKNKYGITDIYAHLKDSSDLLNEIKAMNGVELGDLYLQYFTDLEDKYTDEITLQIIIALLLNAKNSAREIYNDDLGSIGTDEKIRLNSLNQRVAAYINLGLDYTLSIYNFDDQSQIDELRNLVVDGYYADVLRQNLRKFTSPNDLQGMKIAQLHDLATQNDICFNKVLFALKDSIESAIIKVDFNSQSVSWIIIAYFFEICDVGVKQ
ncbi:hypothetical protein VCSRO184_1243 [Vibrio cholerae]|uniref:SMEK domain-containing protein n=1 Tax=Vibrio cholerae TaxID=666 RepID=UPI000E0BB675|nr:SMEK domain-containing protein [Vibrio cholerae]EKF9276916.1 SMEK domain-containing protein [Vibrio cholerae]EKF9279698.1 SMEK domain-containing protein [Vibrio cholerae]MDV2402479.1 SMEK domain-containing protein [Vibrio cholerae]GIB02388.1 hypothetical protein VCSRO184_1243 [Vibrio cholerae]